MRISLSNLDELDLDQLHPTHRYPVEVVRGLRVACRRERQACERHLRDLERQGSEDFPWVFDETRATRIFDWFERVCRHVRGPYAGQPIKLLPFQKFDLGSLFGWVHKDTGERRFKKSFNMRARGNVKSTEMSGIALYGMCSDAIYPPGRPDLRQYEDSPEVECAAVDKDQAKRVWGDAKAMGEKSPDISKRLRIRRTYIEHMTRGGWLRPLSKDTKNKDSGAPCVVIIDEYHAHQTSEIHDVLYSGFGKRRQPLMCIITTAGKDAENSPAKKEYDICCKILDGEIVDERYLVIIRELDDGDDPHDESLWVKANPVLQEDNEYSRILLEQIRDEYNKAFGSGDPAKIREFMTKRLDLWMASSEEKYMTEEGMRKWKEELALPREQLLELIRGRPCWVGVDLSKRIDLTADGFVVPLGDGRIAIMAHGFMPEETAAKHERTDRMHYRHWAKLGWCTITPGAVTDDEWVKKHIQDTEQQLGLDVREVCFDPWGARQFGNMMAAEGYTCVEILQRFSHLSEPTKKFREMVLQGKIVHDGNPILTWCLSNAYEISDANENIRVSKRTKDDTQRVDLLAAVLNAFSRAILNAEQRINLDEFTTEDFLKKLWG